MQEPAIPDPENVPSVDSKIHQMMPEDMQYQIAIQDLPIGIFIFGKDGNLEKQNQKSSQILQHDLKTISDLIGMFELSASEVDVLKKWFESTDVKPDERKECLHRCSKHPMGQMIRMTQLSLPDEKKCITIDDITNENKTAFELNERLKELTFLHNRLTNLSGIFELDDFLQKTIDEFAPAMLFPELTCVQILFNPEEKNVKTLATGNWENQKGALLKAPIKVNNVEIGELQVGYTEDVTNKNLGFIHALTIDKTFLEQEQALIESTASLIGEIINIKTTMDDISRAQEALKVLSTPVMVVWDRILFLPLVGPIDSKRSQMIMDSLLSKVIDIEAKYALVDIQGVPAMDTAVANHLIKLTKAIKLLGCSCIITGVSSKISQTLVQLGVDFSTFETSTSLKEGLKKVLIIIKDETK